MNTHLRPAKTRLPAFVLILSILLVGMMGLDFLQPTVPVAALQVPIPTRTFKPAPVPGAKLEISKTVESPLVNDLNGNGLIDPGDTVRYKIEYKNTGNVEVTGIRLVDDYDQSVIAGIANVTLGGTDNRDVITWDLGSLKTQSVGTVTYEATFNSVFVPDGSRRVENLAKISSNETDEVSASLAVDLRIPNLKASKTRELIRDVNSNGLPDPGDTIRYTIMVRNAGDTEAVNLFIRDDFNQMLLGQPTGISNNGLNNGDVISWDVNRLDPGREVSNSYDVTLVVTFPMGKSTVRNLVTVSSRVTSSITAENSFEIEVIPTVTPTSVTPPPPTPTSEPSFKPAGPTGESISASAQAMLAAGFMILALGGLIALGYLSFHDKTIPSTIRDGYILSLVMGTVIILGLAGSVERSAIAGLIGTVAGYVLRSVVEAGGQKPGK